jgi:hypothetical protein
MGTELILSASQRADREAMGTDRLQYAATPASNIIIADADDYLGGAQTLEAAIKVLALQIAAKT